MAIVTDKVIPVADTYANGQTKDPASSERAIKMYADLEGPNQRPLGMMRDENFGMPKNYVPPPARIYVINHSRTRPWKRLTIAVSMRNGADELLERNPKLLTRYNADSVYRRVEQGHDMNEYTEAIQPVAVQLITPGGPNGMGGSHKSGIRVVPPSQDPDIPPMRVEVPEGAWDLYLGNYERMHSKDTQVVADEKLRLANYWKRRHNPVFQYTDDGVTEDMRNPFGCLEFVRETIVAVREPIDQAYLAACDLYEAI